MKQKVKITLRALTPFFLYVFLYQVGGSLHYTMLPPVGERILPVWLVGVIIGGGAFLQLILDIPAGKLLDKFGYQKILWLTALIFAVATFVWTLPLSTFTYITSLVIASIGWLFYGPGGPAYILVTSPQDKAGKYMGFKDMAKSGGTVVAMFLLTFGLILPLRTTALGMTLMFLLAAAALAFAPQEPHRQPEKVTPTHHYFIRRKFITDFIGTIKRFNPVSTTLLLLNFSSSAFYAVIWFTVPLALVHQPHAGWSEAGLAVFDFAVVVLGGVLGQIADKYNKKMLVLIGLIVFALMGTGIGFTLGIWFIVIGFLATAGDEMAGLSLWSWLNELDKEHAEDGYISGIITFFSDFGWTIGPILAGVCYGILGPQLTLLIGAGFVTITLIVYCCISIRYRHRPQAHPNQLTAIRPRLYKHKH